MAVAEGSVFPEAYPPPAPPLFKGGEKAKRRYVRFTRWRRGHFFRVLAETGHAGMAAEAAGVSLACIYRLRRTEAGFAGKMQAAVAAADAGLRDGGERCSPAVPEALVVRRGIGGRLRVMAAGRRWWTARHDAIFLGWLRATGNVTASARAAGFTPKSVYNRIDRRPAFARACAEALEEAALRLRAKLFEIRHDDEAPALEPGAFDPEPAPADFDAEEAMWLLKMHQRRPLFER